MRQLQKFSIMMILIISVLAGLTGCGSDKSTPVSPDTAIAGDVENPLVLSSMPPDNFIQLGTWTLRLEDAHDGKPAAAELIPLRSSDTHYDVGFALLPPICENCLEIPSLEIIDLDWHVEIRLTNPTIATVYDVMVVVPGNDGPTVMNPSSFTDLFDVDGNHNTHHPMCIFDTGTPQHVWGPGSAYSTEIIFRKYPGDYFTEMIFAITASFPGPQEEVAMLRNTATSGILFSDGSNSIDITVEVIDWQDNNDYVVVDLTVLGGSPYTPMVPDAPGVFTASFSNSSINNGTHECMIAAKSLGSDYLTYSFVTIEVDDPPPPPTYFSLFTGPVTLSGTGTPIGEMDLGVVGLTDGTSRTLVSASGTEIYEWNEDYTESSKFVTIIDITGSNPSYPIEPVLRIAIPNPTDPHEKSTYSIFQTNDDYDPMDDSTDPDILYRNTLEILNLGSEIYPVTDFTLTVDNGSTPELDMILSPVDVTNGTLNNKTGYTLWVPDSGQYPAYYPYVALVRYGDPYKDVSGEYDDLIGGVGEGPGSGMLSANNVTGLAVWDSDGDSDLMIFVAEAGPDDEIEIFSMDFNSLPGGELTPVLTLSDLSRTPIDIAILPVGDAGLEDENWFCVLTVERVIEVYTFSGELVEFVGDSTSIPYTPTHMDADMENMRIHVLMQGPRATVFEYTGVE